MPDVYDAIKNRRSIRQFLPKRVSNSLVRQIIDAARWAPSAHNAQPWRFKVIRDCSVKRLLAKGMAIEWDRAMREEGITLPERQQRIRLSVQMLTNAPVLIAVFLAMGDMEEYPDQKRQNAETIMGVQSVAAAVQNMLLVAYSKGLGTCWSCAPLFCPEKVRKILKTPPVFSPQALLMLGYPAKKPKPTRRRRLPIGSLIWGDSRRSRK